MQEPSVWQFLDHYKIVEAILAIFTITLGAAAVFRGTLDKKTPDGRSTNGAPSWALYGPVHDTMEVIRAMSENGREYNRIMSRIEEKMHATGKAQLEAILVLKGIEDVARENLNQLRAQTMLLEDIRNNQVARPEGSIGIPRRK